jgi:hypothetical protein
MKTIKLFVFLVLFQISLISCKQSTEEQLDSNWSLALLDSLQVEHLGEMMLLDISPNHELFLTAVYQKDTYYLIDKVWKKLNLINK